MPKNCITLSPRVLPHLEWAGFSKALVLLVFHLSRYLLTGASASFQLFILEEDFGRKSRLEEEVSIE